MRKSIFEIASESINMSNEVDRIVNMSLTEKSMYRYGSYTLFNFVDEYCFKKWCSFDTVIRFIEWDNKYNK